MKDTEWSLDKEKQTLFYESVGNVIRYHRVKMLLTQEDLSFMFGVSRVSINNIENGKQRLPLHLIVALSEMLKIPLDVLIPEYTHKVKTIDELRRHKIDIALGRVKI